MSKILSSILLISICLDIGALSGLPVFAATAPSYDKKMQLGQLLYYNGNVEQAIKAFRPAISLDPKAFEPHLNLVNIYVQTGDISQAIEECHAVLKIKSKHRDVHLILGNLLRSEAGKNKDFEAQQRLLSEAEAHVYIAETLGADPAMVHNTLGIIKVQQGNTDEAMQHMEKALSSNQKLPDAHLVKSVLHFKRGENELAIKHLDLAVTYKNNNNAEARNTKADILFCMKKYDQALEEYKEATKNDPRHEPSWMGQATCSGGTTKQQSSA